jgi:hypothetical protein
MRLHASKLRLMLGVALLSFHVQMVKRFGGSVLLEKAYDHDSAHH